MKYTGLYILFIFIIFQCPLFSQAYYIKKYNTGSGLVDPTVRALSQDSLGRIWIGTAEGLSIYDGNSFTNFIRGNGLKNDVINCFFPLSRNTMLVGTLRGGIEVVTHIPYTKDTVSRIINSKKFLVGNEINQIFKDSNNNYWICTSSGITKWKINNENITKVNNFSKNNLPGNPAVYSVVEVKNGNMLFGTSKGLLKLSGNKFTILPASFFPHIIINDFLIDSDNNLWVSTSKGVFLSKYENSRFEPCKKLLSIHSSFYFTGDEDGSIWITYEKGLVKYNKITGTLTEINQFKDVFCTALLKDNEGNIWIGTLNGLNKFPQNKFLYLSKYHRTLGITHIAKNNKGKIFVSTTNGLFRTNNKKILASSFSSLFKKKYLRPVLFDGNKIWIGTNKGLYRIRNHSVKLYSIKNGLPFNFVYSLAEDSSGNIWVGTDYGLAVIKKNKIISTKFYPKSNKDSTLSFLKILPIERVSAILCDHNNNMWFGYWNKGLFQLKNGKLIKYNKSDGFFDDNIRGLYEDKEYNIWIGTRYGGVYKFDKKHFTHYTTKNGLQSNFVSSIIEDNKNNYWFGTAKGVTKFDGKYWKKFDASDGINSSGILSIISDKKGNLYFACHEGIYIYLNKSFNYKPRKPKVYIKKVQLINGKFLNTSYSSSVNINHILSLNSIKRRDKISLNYHQNSLQFEFYTDSYKNEIKTEYKYKLEGLNTNWSELSRRNYITFNNLPAGSYTLDVKALNSDGLYSARAAKFSFEIQPPFWQTWWFISICIIFITAIISGINFLIYRYRTAQLLKMEKIRTGIATDLHDDIGTSLSRISIFSQLAKREIKNHSNKIFNLLDKIETSSRSLIDSMDDIVWAINPDNDSLEDVILKMQNFAVELFEAKGIEVSISAPHDINSIELPLDLRRQLLLVFKEIVNNTAKYSGAENVFINIRMTGDVKADKKGIKIKVRDDGRGFNINEEHNGNGLKNMRNRVDTLNGMFRVTSIQKRGTTFELFVPL